MRIRLKLHGWLRDVLPANPATLDVPEDTTASGVMDHLHLPIGPCLWVVNGEKVGYDRTLHEGDLVEAAPMAAGG
jgi:sulfur carrier protein ThiS